MRARQLRELSDEDLDKRLGETRRELFNLRFQSVTGALESSAQLNGTRREISRILTIKNERSRSAGTLRG